MCKCWWFLTLIFAFFFNLDLCFRVCFSNCQVLPPFFICKTASAFATWQQLFMQLLPALLYKSKGHARCTVSLLGPGFLWALYFFPLWKSLKSSLSGGTQRSVKSLKDGSDTSRFGSCCCDSIFGFLIGMPQKKLRVGLDCLLASHVEVHRKWCYFCKLNFSSPLEYARRWHFCYRGVAWGFIKRKKKTTAKKTINQTPKKYTKEKL